MKAFYMAKVDLAEIDIQLINPFVCEKLLIVLVDNIVNQNDQEMINALEKGLLYFKVIFTHMYLQSII